MTMRDYETWQFEKEQQVVVKCCDPAYKLLIFYFRPIRSREQSQMTRMELPSDLFTRSGRACNSSVPFGGFTWMKAAHLLISPLTAGCRWLPGNHVRSWGSWRIWCLETCSYIPRERYLDNTSQLRGIHMHLADSYFILSRSPYFGSALAPNRCHVDTRNV